MNITLEHQQQCQATIHVEVPPETVSAERAAITGAFLRQAKIPGYRPGKAPVSLIQNRFKDDILEELEARLLNQGFKEGVKKEDLKVISITGVRDGSFNNDDSFSFTADILLAPDFELPEYKGIKIQVPRVEATDEDVDRMLEGLRERFADFVDVEGRPLRMDDFAVIKYSATMDGAPLAGSVPEGAAHLGANDDFWVRMSEDSFLPGLCAGLVDAARGETRSVNVTIPDDFPLPDLAGKEVVYEIEIKEIKEQKLPEVDDAFAGKLEEGKSLAEVREAIREQILAERTKAVEEMKTNEILAFLDEKLKFDLPGALVNSEAQRQVNDIVLRNRMRGMGDEQILEQEEEIKNYASNQAAMNVKTTFILEEIADAEEIEPTDQEIMRRIAGLAMQNQVPLKKFIAHLKKSNGVDRIRNNLRISKTLDFLRANASVEEVDPPNEPA